MIICSMITHLITAIGYVRTWMGNCLSFIALLMSLMALQLVYVDQNTVQSYSTYLLISCSGAVTMHSVYLNTEGYHFQ